MKYLLTFLLLNSAACTKYASLSRDTVGTQVSQIEMDISYLTEIPWNVGLKKEYKVTQSFSFHVSLPKLKKNDLKYLSDNKNIDSWIIRLIHKKRSERSDLGSMYIPFQSKNSSSRVALKVYYAAAYASERFRALKCPAFNHNRQIEKMSIEGTNEPFDIELGQSKGYGERAQLVELNPSSFNAGNSVVGEYWIEIAPYDSKRKVIYATFKRIPRHVVIYSENIVNTTSCDGLKMENSL